MTTVVMNLKIEVHGEKAVESADRLLHSRLLKREEIIIIIIYF